MPVDRATRGKQPEGDISPSGLSPRDQRNRVQRSREDKSWGTRQRHAKPNVVVDVARGAPVTKGAAHVPRIDPEGAAPQDAETPFGCS